jgi:hypothetical protein
MLTRAVMSTLLLGRMLLPSPLLEERGWGKGGR